MPSLIRLDPDTDKIVDLNGKLVEKHWLSLKKGDYTLGVYDIVKIPVPGTNTFADAVITKDFIKTVKNKKVKHFRCLFFDKELAKNYDEKQHPVSADSIEHYFPKFPLRQHKPCLWYNQDHWEVAECLESDPDATRVQLRYFGDKYLFAIGIKNFKFVRGVPEDFDFFLEEQLGKLQQSHVQTEKDEAAEKARAANQSKLQATGTPPSQAPTAVEFSGSDMQPPLATTITGTAVGATDHHDHIRSHVMLHAQTQNDLQALGFNCRVSKFCALMNNEHYAQHPMFNLHILSDVPVDPQDAKKDTECYREAIKNLLMHVSTTLGKGRHLISNLPSTSLPILLFVSVIWNTSIIE